MRVRLQVAYDGRQFHGFAPQSPGVRTVGGVLAGALERILRLPAAPTLTCAGRTDAGVHAWDQWVHLDVPESTSIDPVEMRRRLLKILGPEVVVRSVGVAPEGWDARRSALTRTYRYAVLTTVTPDPFRAGFVWWVPAELDVRAMQLGCDAVVGEHDFASFCRKQPGKHQVRTVREAGWKDLGRGELQFEITADAFCQQMVRALVGTLVDVGTGKKRAGEMMGILRARDRSAAGPVAPPDGLVLAAVAYPSE